MRSGGGEIRTRDALSDITVFKTVSFNHSDTPPPCIKSVLNHSVNLPFSSPTLSEKIDDFQTQNRPDGYRGGFVFYLNYFSCRVRFAVRLLRSPLHQH